MHHFFLTHLVHVLANYGYVILLPIAVVEGPLAAVIAGAFVASGEFDFFTAFLLLCLADIVGDVLYYSLGRWSHERLFGGLERYLGITEERVASLHKGFSKHDWKFILFGKTQALGSIILYFAGATRMRFWRFIGWNVLGTIPKVALFELIGIILGQGALHSTRYLDIIGIATFVMAGLLVVAYVVVSRYLGNQLKNI